MDSFRFLRFQKSRDSMSRD